MLMKDYINKINESLQNNNCSQFDVIYFGVKDGVIVTDVEDIGSICDLFISGFENMEPHQQRKIAKMPFYICDRHGLEKGLVELIKGLKRIYNKSLSDYEKKLGTDFSYEELIEEFVGTFVCSYDEGDMLIFGNLLSKDDCQEFKKKLIEILQEDMEYQEEDFKRKGNLLIKNVN